MNSDSRAICQLQITSLFTRLLFVPHICFAILKSVLRFGFMLKGQVY